MFRTLTASDRASLIRLASSLPVGSPERKAILAGLSKTAAVKPADLEALKKVEAEEGMDPKAIGLSVSKIVALEKLGLVHYDRGDGSVYLTTEGRKHSKKAASPQNVLAGLAQTAAVKGDLYFEGGAGDERTLWKKGVTPDQAEKMISDWEKKFEIWEEKGMKGKPPGPMVEGGTPVFVAEDGTEMMYTDTWENMD